MLPGPSVRFGRRDVLTSPARLRVRRYLKGDGPRTVRVQTGLTGPGSVAEDGLMPAAGERWTIYTRSRHEPYATGICEGSHRTASRRPDDPRNFVYVTGARNRVELRSAATGRLVQRVAAFGEPFTGNGLSISPDGADIYVTLIGKRHLNVERVAVADGKRSFVAAGQQPAVSPDGRRLAYIADRGERARVVAVQQRSTGRTLALDIGHLVGDSAEVLNGTIAWLGNGSDFVTIPGPIATRSSPAAPGAGNGTCASATCLIVMHVGPRRLSGHRVVLPGPPDAMMKFAPDGTRPHSLLLARGLDRTTVERIALHGSRAAVTRLAALPDAMPIALSPSGTHLLYLRGHNPPALWVGRVADGHITDRHQLIADARLDAATW